MATKFYAVKKGLVTGIFHTWDECKASVNGYSGAEYKSFSTMEEAKAYLGYEPKTDMAVVYGQIELPVEGGARRPGPADKKVVPIYVDGSYNAATGEFSYGVVVLLNGEEITLSKKFDDEELATMRNVAGEIKGAEAAMQYALEHGIKKIAIYHDYEGIAKWCIGAWKTNKDGTKAYKAFYEAASRQLEITFVKVAGHSGDKYNDMADKLAKEALGI